MTTPSHSFLRGLGVTVSAMALALGLVATPAPVTADEQVWVPRQKLEASDGQIRDRFGEAVAIDGDTLVVGAPDEDELGLDAGAVYLFERSPSGEWIETLKLVEEDGHFGIDVALDRDTLAIRASFVDDLDGAAFIYRRGEEVGAWELTAKVKSPNPEQQLFGAGSLQGDEFFTGDSFADLAAPNAGAVYIFQRDAGGPDAWGHVETLTAPDAEIGDNLSVTAVDGDTLAVGAWGNNDLGIDTGAAYVFERDAKGQWIPIQKLHASLPGTSHQFGGVIAIDGQLLVFGVQNDTDHGHPAGSAYIFERDGEGLWWEEARITSSDGEGGDSFGEAVAIVDGRVVVGASGDDDQGPANGAAYVFERDELAGWRESAKLTGTPGGDPTGFGSALATGGERLVVGSLGDDTRGLDVGSAYLFELARPTALRLHLSAEEVRAGEPLGLATMLRYHEADAVTAPCEVMVLDDSGAEVTTFTTAPRTFKPGEKVPASYTVTLPADLPPGDYDLVAGLLGAGDDGSEPIAWDSRQFTVVP